jgi:hypothetical protein
MLRLKDYVWYKDSRQSLGLISNSNTELEQTWWITGINRARALLKFGVVIEELLDKNDWLFFEAGAKN